MRLRHGSCSLIQINGRGGRGAEMEGFRPSRPSRRRRTHTRPNAAAQQIPNGRSARMSLHGRQTSRTWLAAQFGLRGEKGRANTLARRRCFPTHRRRARSLIHLKAARLPPMERKLDHEEDAPVGASSIAGLSRPLRALAAFLVTAALLGAAATVAASAFLFGFLLYRVGGLMFHTSVAAVRILGSFVVVTLILTRALLGAVRSVWA